MLAPPLPSPPTTFVGRRTQIGELVGILAANRMVTLVGPGGVGKTRLAIEVVRHAAALSAREAAFVDLSGVLDPAAVPAEVAARFRVRPREGCAPAQGIAAEIGAQPLLLLVDNCEQIARAARDLAGLLLGVCPGLSVVATSREPLHVGGEITWLVPPMTLARPAPSVTDAAGVAGVESIELFVDRASSTGAPFVLSASSATLVAQICHMLDGLPLAIELAASWAPVLGVGGIAGRRARWPDLLSQPHGDSTGRHHSLRTVLEWSRKLLSGEEASLWSRLAIFAPSFDLDAVEAVCSDETIAAVDVAPLLRTLVERSLVQVEIDARQVARYRLLETVREYALERLRASGDFERVAVAHSRYYAGLAEEAFRHRDGSALIDWAERMTAEHANVRTALEWLRGHDREGELQLAGAMAWVWGARELLPEGRRLLELAVAGSESTSWFAARASRAAGMLAMDLGDRAAAIYHLRRALALHEQLADAAGQAICLARLGALERPPANRILLERAVELAAASGERAAQVVALSNLGALELERNNGRGARATYERAAAVSREMRHARWLPQILEALAHAYLAEGNIDAARRCLLEALEVSTGAGLRALAPTLLESMTEVDFAAKSPDRALRLAAAATTLRREGGGVPHEWPDALSQAVAGARRHHGRAADAAWEEGLALSVDEAVALARSTDHERVRGGRISRRQLEVAALVADGLTNAQIALRLSISERTAEWHVEELRNRLGFISRSQVAAWAAREGLHARQG